MSRMLAVTAKELLDALRDRRTLLTMIVGPALVMPLIMLLPQALLRQQVEVQRQAALQAAAAGLEHAPELASFLRAQGVELAADPDPEGAVAAGRTPVGLRVEPGFAAEVAAGRSGRVAVLADGSRLASAEQAERLRALLRAYHDQVVARRLAERGIDPALLQPFAVELRDLATPGRRGGVLLGLLLPLFLVLWAALGGMYAAIDATAGEKERHTLEPLLHAPVSRLELVLGKLLAVVAASGAAVVLAVGGIWAGLALAGPVVGGEGEVAFRLPAGTALRVLAVLGPVVVTFAALELAAGLYARGFREAQNYIALMQLALMVPAVAVSAMPELDPPAWAFAVPLFGPMVALRQAFAGGGTAAQWAVAVAGSLACAALAVALAVRLFRDERVIFRG